MTFNRELRREIQGQTSEGLKRGFKATEIVKEVNKLNPAEQIGYLTLLKARTPQLYGSVQRRLTNSGMTPEEQSLSRLNVRTEARDLWMARYVTSFPRPMWETILQRQVSNGNLNQRGKEGQQRVQRLRAAMVLEQGRVRSH